jgi:excisionase family DNA binding protein
MNTDDLVTVADAAARMGITRDGVMKAIYNGTLPHERLFGRILIRRDALERYQATKKVGRPKKVAA